MDKIPKTDWTWSPETEVERVVHATKVGSSGFYERHGFVIVPKLGKLHQENQVVIPDLGYNLIPGYWDKIAGVPLQLPIAVPREIGEVLATRIGEWSGAGERITTLAQEWGQIESVWWSEIAKILSEESLVVGEVEVRLTRYGTISSFAFLTKQRGQKLIIYLREDGGVAHLAEAIVTAMLYPYRDDLGLSWSKREAIVDFYLTRRPMRQLIPDYRPTLTHLPRISSKMRELSQRYVNQLGWPVRVEEQARLIARLSTKEAEVARLLWEKRGELVSFDEISDLIWGEGEFGTFWAINKRVQRLRQSLTKLGIAGEQIKTLRGRGYIWQT